MPLLAADSTCMNSAAGLWKHATVAGLAAARLRRVARCRYPSLYLNDGQNLFDAATAFAGVHWQVGETATRLIGERKIPPLIIVGIDNTKSRIHEYIPYRSKDPRVCIPRGSSYPEFLRREVMPLIEERYRCGRGRSIRDSADLRSAD